MGKKARVAIGTVSVLAVLFLTVAGAFSPLIGPAGQNGINGMNGTNGQDGTNGRDGNDGVGILSIQQVTFEGTTTLFVYYTDGTVQQLSFSTITYSTTIVNPTTYVYTIYGLTSTVTFTCNFTTHDLTSSSPLVVTLSVDPTTAVTSCTVIAV